MTAPLQQTDVIMSAKKQSTLGNPAYAVKTMDGLWEVASTKPTEFRVCITFTSGNPSTPEIAPEEIGMGA